MQKRRGGNGPCRPLPLNRGLPGLENYAVLLVSRDVHAIPLNQAEGRGTVIRESSRPDRQLCNVASGQRHPDIAGSPVLPDGGCLGKKLLVRSLRAHPHVDGLPIVVFHKLHDILHDVLPYCATPNGCGLTSNKVSLIILYHFFTKRSILLSKYWLNIMFLQYLFIYGRAMLAPTFQIILDTSPKSQMQKRRGGNSPCGPLPLGTGSIRSERSPDRSRGARRCCTVRAWHTRGSSLLRPGAFRLPGRPHCGSRPSS